MFAEPLTKNVHQKSCNSSDNFVSLGKVAHYLSAGFQSRESKPQLSLWSEIVLKAVVGAFGEAGHGGEANVPFVLIPTSNHRK